MEKNKEYHIIGSCELRHQSLAFKGEQTDQGYCYKSEQAFKEKRGICYIAECAWVNENEYNEVIVDYDNYDKLLLEGAVSTYETLRKDVREAVLSTLPRTDNNEDIECFRVFIDSLTEYVFNLLDWKCADTIINEIDIEDEWGHFVEDWLKEKDQKG